MADEFTRLIKASHIHGSAQSFRVEADAAARAALAQRFGLPDIAQLSGDFTLMHEAGGVISARLSLQASFTHICVVSLEPFKATLGEDTALRFIPAAKLADAPELDPETLEGPDEIPYENDDIDLGEALAEQLALALDPYPRKPGAELPAAISEAEENPFTILRGKFGNKDD